VERLEWPVQPHCRDIAVVAAAAAAGAARPDVEAM